MDGRSKVIFPGSFDPWTYAHQSILERACALFDEVTVGVCKSPNHKKVYLADDLRYRIIKQVCEGKANVQVKIFQGLVTGFCEQERCFNVIRGVRRAQDFQYEWEMYHHNQVLSEEIEWLLLPCRKEYMGVSSSLVKEIYQHGGDITSWVPGHVIKAMEQQRRVDGA